MRRGHCEIEFTGEGADVVIAIRDADRRNVTLKVSRAGLRAFAAIAESAARDRGDECALRCAVKGELL